MLKVDYSAIQENVITPVNALLENIEDEINKILSYVETIKGMSEGNIFEAMDLTINTYLYEMHTQLCNAVNTYNAQISDVSAEMKDLDEVIQSMLKSFKK